MKREEIVRLMRIVSNYKMEFELELQKHEGKPVKVNAKGWNFYFSCCYVLGRLVERLQELDRKRNERMRNKMYKRYAESGGTIIKAMLVERNKKGDWRLK